MTSLPPPFKAASLTDRRQAASALESLKMESPVKKLQMDVEADKENIDARYEADEVAIPIKGIPDLADPEETEAAPAAADGSTEEDDEEPILKENAQRFVLFPIKYHEVRRRARCLHATRNTHASRV
jgi:ribonucleoside-diphosphate reductase subunit M2